MPYADPEKQKAWRLKNRGHLQAYFKRYHEENREKRLAQSKSWYAENREKCVQRQKLWRLDNPAAFKIWYEKNRDSSLERNKQWRRANPERVRELNWRHQGICLTFSEYLRMKQQQDGSCAICARRRKVLDVDHNHETGQVRALLCASCNILVAKYEAGRRVKNPDAFLEYLLAHDSMYERKEA